MITIQVEYKGKKEKVVLDHPTYDDRIEYLYKMKSIRKAKGDDEDDALIDFIKYRVELTRRMIVESPFPKEELTKLSAVEADKIIHAIDSEINLTAGFQTPSNGPPPTEQEES